MSQSLAESPEEVHETSITALPEDSESVSSEVSGTKVKAKCCVCSMNFGVTRKKKICINCGRTVCSLHSGGKSAKDSERVCEDCKREKLYLETGNEKWSERDEILKQIQEKMLEREEKTKELNKASGKLRKLEASLRESEAKYDKVIADHEEQLSLQKEKNTELNAFLEVVKEKHQKMTQEKQVWIDKLAKLDSDKTRVEYIVEEMRCENRQSASELEELVEFIQTRIHLKLVKDFLCSLCYKSLQKDYIKTFRPDTRNEPRSESVYSRPDMDANSSSKACNCTTF